MSLRLLTFLTTLLHFYIGLRLVPALAAWPAAGPAFAVLLLVSAIALPMPFRHRSGGRRAAGPVWSWIGLLAMGWFSSLFVLTLLRDLGLIAAWAGGWLQGGAVAADSAAAVVLAATLASLAGFWNARRTARVKRVDVKLPGLPAALHGFTIAQLSDLHVGPTIRRGYVARIVARVNALGADAVAITGDLVDGSVPALREHIAPLADLRAKHGSFAVILPPFHGHPYKRLTIAIGGGR
ncbi:hypothetical protein [Xylophilus sp.]|uniref:hypothetical protein n=1 Tax=Xylophilus sp. TaxID=2653893 RepID=UPI0013BB24EF|nr:MAG: UDP-2,3-diacylglucosamine pyrophosphatase LpxG [Xylophilus sp.]